MVLNLKCLLWCEKEKEGYVHLISSSSFTKRIHTISNQPAIFYAYRQKGSLILCKYLGQTSQVQNSKKSDESEINEKDEETVTLDDPITNETKEVPAVIID